MLLMSYTPLCHPYRAHSRGQLSSLHLLVFWAGPTTDRPEHARAQWAVEQIAISNRRFLLIQSAATKTVPLLSLHVFAFFSKSYFLEGPLSDKLLLFAALIHATI